MDFNWLCPITFKKIPGLEDSNRLDYGNEKLGRKRIIEIQNGVLFESLFARKALAETLMYSLTREGLLKRRRKNKQKIT